MLVDRAHRAHFGAMAAKDAWAVGKSLGVRGANRVIGAATGSVDCPDCLYVMAGFNAAPAFNALIHVPDHGVAGNFFYTL